MNSFANLHLRAPRLLWMAILVTTGLAMAGAARVRFDSDPRLMMRTNDAAFQQLEEFNRDFAPDDQDIVIFIRTDDLFTIPAITALRSFVQELRNDPDIDRVASLVSLRHGGPASRLLIPSRNVTPERLEQSRQWASQNPVAAEFVSGDGRATVVSARLAGRDVPVERLDTISGRVLEAAARHLSPASMQAALTGHPAIRIAVLQTLQREVSRFAVLGALLSGIIALAVFRNVPAVIMALLAPTLGVLWTLGLMGWLGVPIDPLLVVLPTLLFVVGFTDSVHMIYDIQTRLHEGHSHDTAGPEAVRDIGPACLLTALTTMAGFGSLLVARNVCVQRFGGVCALGAGTMFLAVQLVIPRLAATSLGKRLASGRTTAPQRMRKVGAFRWIVRNPRRVAFASVAVTAACFLTSLQLRSDLRWLETLPRDSDVVAATQDCDRTFGGAMRGSIVVEWPEGMTFQSSGAIPLLRDIHRAIEQTTDLSHPLSIVSFLETITPSDGSNASQESMIDRLPLGALSSFYRKDLRRAVVSMHVPDLGAARLRPQFDALETRLQALAQAHSGFSLHLTGTVIVAARNVHQIVEDLGLSLTLASIVIFLMMSFVFRSLFLGILTVIPNVFPQAITASMLVWWGEPLTVTTVLTFSLCLGLSVDDTVHFLMRYVEQRNKGETAESSAEIAFHVAGSPMLATSLVLIGGFAAMSISRMPGIQHFSLLCCLTLIAALAGDLVMLPALLVSFSRHRGLPAVAATPRPGLE